MKASLVQSIDFQFLGLIFHIIIISRTYMKQTKKLYNTLDAIEDIEWQITKVSAIRVPQGASDQIRRKVKEMRSQAMKALRQTLDETTQKQFKHVL